MANPTVNWGDLWDQTEAVSGHTLRGIEFLEKFGNFSKERASIEEEYAAKLRALAKKSGEGMEEDDGIKSFSYVRSFSGLLKEMESLAAQHEVIAERIRKDVVPFVGGRAEAHRQARQQYLGDMQQIHHNLNASIELMLKQQKGYNKAFEEAEAAYLKYYKAERNMEMSLFDLEKAKNNAQTRSVMSEEAKQLYAHALGAANDFQAKHYNQLLPSILDRLKNLNEERIRDTRSAMEMAIRAETDVTPIFDRCHEDMKSSVAQIDVSQDTLIVFESFRTKNSLPNPFPFLDLGCAQLIVLEKLRRQEKLKEYEQKLDALYLERDRLEYLMERHGGPPRAGFPNYVNSTCWTMLNSLACQVDAIEWKMNEIKLKEKLYSKKIESDYGSLPPLHTVHHHVSNSQANVEVSRVQQDTMTNPEDVDSSGDDAPIGREHEANSEIPRDKAVLGPFTVYIRELRKKRALGDYK